MHGTEPKNEYKEMAPYSKVNDDMNTSSIKRLRYGTKRGYLASDGAGTALGAAPWRHTSRPTTTLERFSLTGRPESFQPNQVDPETYAGRSKDLERYRHPATQITRTMDQDAYEVKRMVWREEYLSKNASRASLTPLDHTMKNNTQKFRSSSTARVKLSM